MNTVILKCIWALGNATLLATVAYNCSTIKDGYWGFLLTGMLYLLLLLINQTYILLTCQKRKTSPQYGLIFVCGLSDFLANYCLSKAYFNKMSYYLVIFLSQLTFLVVIGIKKFIFKENCDLSWRKILFFVLLIFFSFLVNYSGTEDSFVCSFYGIALVLMSNILFATSIVIQPMISKNGISFCMRDISVVAFIFGGLISSYFDYEKIGYQCLDFYKKYYINVCGFALAGVAFYMITSPFIRRYGSVSFNAAILAFSVITGIFKGIAGGKYSVVMFCGAVISIICSQLLLILERQ